MARFIIIFLLLVAMCSNTITAQRSTGAMDKEKLGKRVNLKGTISGKIVDASLKVSMEYVTVAVYNKKTNQLIGGITTDRSGEFIIKELPIGLYKVQATFIGYQPLVIDSIRVYLKNLQIDLGKIQLKSDPTNLKEVEVVGMSPTVKYEIDKKVINVSDQNTAAGETAVEILENVPSVKVDTDGNVSLRGSQSFTLLIDGKPTNLETSDALKMIPASSIQDVEIITNPSAKYDAEGVSGIINIVSKKNKLEGVSALINLNLGTYERYGGDATVNITKKKLTFNIGVDYNNSTNPGELDSERKTTNADQMSILTRKGELDRFGVRKGVKAEMEYRINRKNVLTVGGRFGGREFNSSSELTLGKQVNNGILVKQRNKELGIRDFIRSSSNVDFKHFVKGNQKHFFNLRAVYNTWDGEEVIEAEYFDLNGNKIGGNKVTEEGPSNMMRFNFDYTIPLKIGGTFETGVQAQLGESRDDFERFDYNVQTGEYEIQTQFNTKVKYLRDIYAGYMMYGSTYKKLGYQIGLRAELTDREISSDNNAAINNINRLDFFPTAHFSYKLKDKGQLMFNYARRIQRPRSYFFEPFVTWIDAFTVRSGNTQLKPEYINSFELGWSKSMRNANLSVELYHRMIENKTERVQGMYDTNVVIIKPDNVGASNATGLETTWTQPFTKWWKSDLSGNFFNYLVEGELGGQSFDQQSFNWTARWNNTFNIKGGWRLQFTSIYNSETVTAQGKQQGFFAANASLKKDFFEHKLSTILQVRDIFSTTRNETETRTSSLYIYELREPRTPTVLLTISFKINNYNRRRERNVDADI